MNVITTILKLVIEPIYARIDLNSKIEITSEDSSIPLDTSLTVKNVNDSSIKDKIGTENYKSYDISLYSDAKGVKIETLENPKTSDNVLLYVAMGIISLLSLSIIGIYSYRKNQLIKVR